jgi:hypothetical protein
MMRFIGGYYFRLIYDYSSNDPSHLGGASPYIGANGQKIKSLSGDYFLFYFD